MVLKLVKAGYCNSDPVAILNTPFDWVINMLQYENYCINYENEYKFLNTKTK